MGKKTAYGILILVIFSILPYFSLDPFNFITNVNGESIPQLGSTGESPIDSFDVNPLSGRWNVTTTNTPQVSINNGVLDVNTNNGSYNMKRELSALSDNIEIRYNDTLISNFVNYTFGSSTNGFTSYAIEMLPLRFDFTNTVEGFTNTRLNAANPTISSNALQLYGFTTVTSYIKLTTPIMNINADTNKYLILKWNDQNASPPHFGIIEISKSDGTVIYHWNDPINRVYYYSTETSTQIVVNLTTMSSAHAQSSSTSWTGMFDKLNIEIASAQMENTVPVGLPSSISTLHIDYLVFSNTPTPLIGVNTTESILTSPNILTYQVNDLNSYVGNGEKSFKIYKDIDFRTNQFLGFKIGCTEADGIRFIVQDGNGNNLTALDTLTNGQSKSIFTQIYPSTTGLYFQIWHGTSGSTPFTLGSRTLLYYVSIGRDSTNLPFSISFMNKLASKLIANITQFNYNNNSFQFRITLLDQNDNIAYSYYSSVFTNSYVYYRLKIIYDLSKSKFNVELDTDSYDRIFKANFPSDYVNGTKMIPVLFGLDIAPFLNVYIDGDSSDAQELLLDYIDAKFITKKWSQFAPSVGNFITNYYYGAVVSANTENITSKAYWQTIVPNLDSFSGSINSNVTTYAAEHYDVTSQADIYVQNIDSITGEGYTLFDLRIVATTLNPYNISAGVYDYQNNSLHQINMSGLLVGLEYQPSIGFSLSTANGRSEVYLQTELAIICDGGSLNKNDAFTYNVSVANITPHPSQEFRIRIVYQLNCYSSTPDTTNSITITFTNFQLKSHAIWDEWIQGVMGIGSAFTGIVGSGFDYLGRIFSGLVDIVIKVFSDILQNGFKFIVDSVLSIGDGIINALTSVGNQITAVLNSVISAVQGIGTLITDAINTMVSTLSGILDTISDLINTIMGIITDVYNLLLDIVGSIITALLDAVVNFIDILISLTNQLLDWFVSMGMDLLTSVGLTPILDSISNVLSTMINGVIAILNALFQVILWITSQQNISLQFFCIASWILILIVPALGTNNLGIYLERASHIALFDITFGGSVLGIHINVPFIVIPFALSLVLVI